RFGAVGGRRHGLHGREGGPAQEDPVRRVHRRGAEVGRRQDPPEGPQGPPLTSSLPGVARPLGGDAGAAGGLEGQGSRPAGRGGIRGVPRVGHMRAVTVAEPGGPEVLTWGEVPDPVCGPGEVIVDVVATAVNRADLLQRQGFYPPPPGASEILGLECSGVVSEVGADVTDWSVGDEVCALLSGGGYAERVAVPAGQLLPRPAGVELATAAALPEVVCTVWSNVFLLARLRRGDNFLV